MPPELQDVRMTAMDFAGLLDRAKDAPDDSPVHDALLVCAKRLYRMMRHIPGIHNHEDAPERQN